MKSTKMRIRSFLTWIGIIPAEPASKNQDVAMKYLIIGLGNIGAEYEGTRHNIGFDILDELADDLNTTFELGKQGYVTKAKYRGRTLVLLKPTTYVNLSGKALNYWMTQEKIPVERILVVLDDLHLPFGKIKIRTKGSDAGHNGLKHINQTLGHQKYARLKFGIGSDFHQGQQVDFVLGKWTSEEQKELPALIKRSAEACKSFATIGAQNTMSKFNN